MQSTEDAKYTPTFPEKRYVLAEIVEGQIIVECHQVTVVDLEKVSQVLIKEYIKPAYENALKTKLEQMKAVDQGGHDVSESN